MFSSLFGANVVLVVGFAGARLLQLSRVLENQPRRPERRADPENVGEERSPNQVRKHGAPRGWRVTGWVWSTSDIPDFTALSLFWGLLFNYLYLYVCCSWICIHLSRYLIMSQQIMGGVPPIVFLRDKQLAALDEVLLPQCVFYLLISDWLHYCVLIS